MKTLIAVIGVIGLLAGSLVADQTLSSPSTTSRNASSVPLDDEHIPGPYGPKATPLDDYHIPSGGRQTATPLPEYRDMQPDTFYAGFASPANAAAAKSRFRPSFSRDSHLTFQVPVKLEIQMEWFDAQKNPVPTPPGSWFSVAAASSTPGAFTKNSMTEVLVSGPGDGWIFVLIGNDRTGELWTQAVPVHAVPRPNTISRGPSEP